MEAKAKREAMMQVVDRKEDEVIELFPLPKKKIIKSARVNAPATQAHLKSIQHLGYDVVNNAYSISQVNDIIMMQSAKAEDIEKLATAGYDTSNGVTRLEVVLAMNDMIARSKIKPKKQKA